jgi:hypothetical protein
MLRWASIPTVTSQPGSSSGFESRTNQDFPERAAHGQPLPFVDNRQRHFVVSLFSGTPGMQSTSSTPTGATSRQNPPPNAPKPSLQGKSRSANSETAPRGPIALVQQRVFFGRVFISLLGVRTCSLPPKCPPHLHAPPAHQPPPPALRVTSRSLATAGCDPLTNKERDTQALSTPLQTVDLFT